MSVEVQLQSPFGPIRIEATATGIRSVRFGEVSRCDTDEDPRVRDVAALAAEELAAYFRGALKQFSVPVDFDDAGSFQRDIYSALMAVPFGCTTSYAALAADAGRFGAARAVGGAMARNRILIIVPCHRVIASDGRIGGWSGPMGLKEKLHALEGIGPLGGGISRGRGD